MVEKISYKGLYGTVTETVSYNKVNLPNLLRTTIYTGHHKPVIGEEVFLSSCDIPYHNNWQNTWTVKPSNDELFTEVVLELLKYDDSNYEPSKSHNGGKYLDSVWIIRSVGQSLTFEEFMS